MKNGEPDAVLEISPLFATSAEPTGDAAAATHAVKSGESIYFE